MLPQRKPDYLPSQGQEALRREAHGIPPILTARTQQQVLAQPPTHIPQPLKSLKSLAKQAAVSLREEFSKPETRSASSKEAASL